jgi:hypothetical protein
MRKQLSAFMMSRLGVSASATPSLSQQSVNMNSFHRAGTVELRSHMSKLHPEITLTIDREGGDPMDPDEEMGGVNKNIANTTGYFSMILCHAIATNDELAYTKYLRKISARHMEDLRDKVALQHCNLFKQKELQDAQGMIKFKSVKEIFDKAMQLSIATKRELISFDLINYATRNGFQMAISEREMLLLIEDRMYDVIEALINSNSLLKIDRASLDADRRA